MILEVQSHDVFTSLTNTSCFSKKLKLSYFSSMRTQITKKEIAKQGVTKSAEKKWKSVSSQRLVCILYHDISTIIEVSVYQGSLWKIFVCARLAHQ